MHTQLHQLVGMDRADGSYTCSNLSMRNNNAYSSEGRRLLLTYQIVSCKLVQIDIILTSHEMQIHNNTISGMQQSNL